MYLKVKIFDVISPSSFKLIINTIGLHEILQSLPNKENIPQTDEQYVFVYDTNDSIWKRAKKLNSTPEMVQVDFIDEQGQLKLNSKEVFSLPKFCHPNNVPVGCVSCSLWTPTNISWSIMQEMNFLQYEITQGLMASFPDNSHELEPGFPIRLKEKNGDIACYLKFPQRVNLSSGIIRLLHIQSFQKIYVLPETLNDYMEIIGQFVEIVGAETSSKNTSDLNRLKENQETVLYYSDVMSTWLRYKIQSIAANGKSVILFSLDYGRFDEVDASHPLTYCPPELSCLPPAAVCCVYDCADPSIYSPDDVAELETRISGPIYLEVMPSQSQEYSIVRFYDTIRKDKELFTKRNIAKVSSGPFPERVGYWDGKCVITVVDESGENISINMISDEPFQNVITTHLPKEVKLNILQSANVNDPCIVFSSDTLEYYRGRVKAITKEPKGYLVYHVDTGYEEITNELYTIDSELRHFYPLAITCSTVCNGKPLNQKQIDELTKLSSDVCKLRVRFMSSSEPVRIRLFRNFKELFTDDVSLHGLPYLGTYHDGPYVKPGINVGRVQHRPAVSVGGIVTSTHFYIHLESDLKSAQNIADKLSSIQIPEPIPAGTELTGRACAVNLQDSEELHRGKIVKEEEFGSISVELVDRGGYVNLNRQRIMLLPSYLVEIPPVAIRVEHLPSDEILKHACIQNSPVIFYRSADTGISTGLVGTVAPRIKESFLRELPARIVEVSHKVFFVRRTDEKDEFNFIGSCLTKSGLQSLNPSWPVIIGMDCTALSTQFEGDIFRARVLSFPDQNNVEVLYIDWGTVESVPRINLKALPVSLYHIPPLAIRCYSDDTQWENMFEKDFCFKIFGGNNVRGWQVKV